MGERNKERKHKEIMKETILFGTQNDRMKKKVWMKEEKKRKKEFLRLK